MKTRLFLPFFLLLFIVPLQRSAAQDQYTRLFWANSSQNKLENMHFDSTGRTDLVASVSAAGLQVDGMHQKIYWYELTSNSIQRADIDGQNQVTFVNNSGFAANLFVDPVHNYLYWPNYDAGTIDRIGLDGKGYESLFAVNKPLAITMDIRNRKLYWYSEGTMDIRRANLDGSNEEVFVADPGTTPSILCDVVKGFLYWSNYDNGTIEQIKLDGTNRLDFVSAPQAASVVEDLAGHQLYWLSQYDNKIYRVNMDGSGAAEFLSDAGASSQLAIAYDNSYLALPVSWQSFTATPSGNAVLLKWITAAEQNVLGFQVQFSTDGRNWNTLTSLDAAGNAGGGSVYTYTHLSPAKGLNYYRIQQNSADSRSTYSEVRTVKWSENLPLFTVIGNPVSGSMLQIQINRSTDIMLLDMSGRVLINRRAEPGLLQIPMSGYNKGLYMIRAGTETQRVLW